MELITMKRLISKILAYCGKLAYLVKGLDRLNKKQLCVVLAAVKDHKVRAVCYQIEHGIYEVISVRIIQAMILNYIDVKGGK